MVECPECGSLVDEPSKTWSVARKGSTIGIRMGMFRCPECGNNFRSGFKIEKEEVSIKGVVEKIRNIEVGLVNTLKSLREKIKTLETERANLLLEIGELKKMAEGKATALESEIGMLKEEVDSLRQLLGVGEIET